jgi:ubiquinone/menaquinone biosynthesis C-methylase UbiE
VYDRRNLQDVTYRPVHDAVVRRMADAHPGVIVDLGCGTGQLTRRLVADFPDAAVIGLDYSPGMLSRLAGGIPAAQADAQLLPIRDASVDMVVCTESFHWYPDQFAALTGISRALRPGGRLIIASISTVTDLGDSAVRWISTAGGQPIKALAPHRIRRMLRSTGFDVEHQGRVPRAGFLPWPLLTEARRRNQI